MITKAQKLEAIAAQVAHYTEMLGKMDKALGKIPEGDLKTVLVAQRKALVDYIDDLQGIVDTYEKD